MSAAEDGPARGRVRRGVWVARYSDGSGLYLFATEIDALRHAVGSAMEVVHVPYGEDALAYRPKPGS